MQIVKFKDLEALAKYRQWYQGYNLAGQQSFVKETELNTLWKAEYFLECYYLTELDNAPLVLGYVECDIFAECFEAVE